MSLTKKRDDGKSDLLISLARDAIARRLRKHGLAESDADQIAVESAEDVRKAFGGGTHYIPKNVHGRYAERNRAMYEEFVAGATYADLASKYELTEVRIRQVIEIVRRERRYQP